MSLINKMLQDLDSRGNNAGGALPTHVKPVARTAAPLGGRTVALAVAGALAAGGAGWFGWTQFHGAPAARPASAPAPVRALPAPTAPGGMTSTITTAPAAGAISVDSAAPAPAVRDAAPAAPAPTESPTLPRDALASDVRTSATNMPAAAKVGAAPAAEPAQARAERVTAAPLEPGSAAAQAARTVVMDTLAGRAAAPLPRDAHARARAAAREAAHADKQDGQGIQAREETRGQRAEDNYRRALADLAQGRLIEATDALQTALKIDPAHEAARQTLVGLLIEAGRTDAAAQQLQLGLTLDPRQPAMAMLLARLQIEGGASGIDTLQRTLPYAGNDAGYHAFLAAAYARQQRHREAAEQYRQAVRTAPANGVWWMGLGMSLQAEKRNGEALEAFQRAQASGNLAPELQAFVERQVVQLAQ